MGNQRPRSDSMRNGHPRRGSGARDTCEEGRKTTMKRALLLATLLVGCVTITPQGLNVRVYAETRTPEFLTRRDKIESRCKFLKEISLGDDGPNSVNTFRNYGATIGANVVIVGWFQTKELPQASYKGFFYDCGTNPPKDLAP